MSAVLPNPEARWERAGRALNVHVPAGGAVLRLMRRDPAARPKEAALLRRPWKTFRVPRLLAEGKDFLRLELLPLARVPATRAWGRRAGRAMAEIHAVGFRRFGFLDGSLRVAEPMPDVAEALLTYAAPRLRRRGFPAAAAFLASKAETLRAAAGKPVLLHGDFKPSNLHASGGRLAVLDWEFAWAGPALMDVGQLLRWAPPEPFIEGFSDAYRSGGGRLPRGWRALADAFDLVNLAGLLDSPGARRARDIGRRITQTIGA